MMANIGAHGGQEVPHLHIHILAGRPLGPMLDFPVAADPLGDAVLPMRIPPNPALASLVVCTQMLWLVDPLDCTPSLIQLSSSNGLRFTIEF